MIQWWNKITDLHVIISSHATQTIPASVFAEAPKQLQLDVHSKVSLKQLIDFLIDCDETQYAWDLRMLNFM